MQGAPARAQYRIFVKALLMPGKSSASRHAKALAGARGLYHSVVGIRYSLLAAALYQV